MRYPSGSKIGLAARCAHPFNSGIKWPWSEQSAAAAYGDTLHRYAENYALGIPNPTPTDERLLREAPTVEQHIDNLLADGWVLFVEIAVAIDMATGKVRLLKQRKDEAGRPEHRDYHDKRTGEIALTLDIVAIKEGQAKVQDWKTGRRPDHDCGDTTWQMALGGLCVARLLGADEVEVAMLFPDVGGTYPDRTTLYEWDLDLIAEGLADIYKMVSGGPTPPHRGQWCTDHYCPIIGECSATKSALARVVNAGDDMLDKLDDPKVAAKAIEMFPIIERLLKDMKARVNVQAERTPLELSDGRVYGAQEQQRETINPRRALPILREHHGDDVDNIVSMRITKADVERLPDGKETMKRLREEGATEHSVFKVFKAMKRKSA